MARPVACTRTSVLASLGSHAQLARGRWWRSGPRGAARRPASRCPATRHGRCAAVVIEGTAARHLKAAKFAGRLVAPAVQPSTACAARRAATTWRRCWLAKLQPPVRTESGACRDQCLQRVPGTRAEGSLCDGSDGTGGTRRSRGAWPARLETRASGSSRRAERKAPRRVEGSGRRATSRESAPGEAAWRRRRCRPGAVHLPGTLPHGEVRWSHRRQRGRGGLAPASAAGDAT